jgi:hypothetical protein
MLAAESSLEGREKAVRAMFGELQAEREYLIGIREKMVQREDTLASNFQFEISPTKRVE